MGFEKFQKVGFTDLAGKKEQIAIGEINELDTHIEVETLPGCSEVALMEAMRQIAQEKQKTVKAKFNDKELVVEPEKMEK